MKTLIIAEKPSLAKNICTAISPTPTWVQTKGKSCGYYENKQYVISYAFGHLLKLKDAEDYNPEYAKWELEDLPIIPSAFSYKRANDEWANKQLTLLLSLIDRGDIDKIINAGDSDREGEIIIRNIITLSKTKKPVYRLWLPDQTEKTIKAELSAGKSDSAYDNLANEGYARTYIDWLYGINLTRLASIKTKSYSKYKRALRVGRVTTPIVVAICERERTIKGFISEKYYVAAHDDKGIRLTSKYRHKDECECDRMSERYNGLDTYVAEKTTTRKIIPRPKLLSLSELQGIAGKALGFSPKKTLDILQELYEARFVTYPRTDSQYMAEGEKGRAKEIIAAIQAGTGAYADISFREGKSIFDNSHVTVHSAITPTAEYPKNICGEQKRLYDIVLSRFAAVFCSSEYIIDRTNVVISNGDESFKLTGDIVISEGYTKYEPVKMLASLPAISKGDRIVPHFASSEKRTSPPEHYTAETLNSYLKSPYSSKEKKELSVEDSVELGTEATRAGLIEAAIKSGYITLEKNKFGITDFGEFYVDSLADLEIDMTKERTLNLGKLLMEIYSKHTTIKKVVDEAKADLLAICSGLVPAKKEGERIICPKCKSPIKETEIAFTCSNAKCDCVLFKQDNFLYPRGMQIDEKIAKDLFTRGFTDIERLVSPKSGITYAARVHADFSGKWVKYQLQFDYTPERKEEGRNE